MRDFKINFVRGMHECLPNDIYIYQYIEKKIKKLMWNYSFEEIRFPIIENSNLFNKVIDINNDLVSKEMYFLNDCIGESLSLRPEGTICCLKTYIKNRLFLKKFLNKLWYVGPMFRHERPQKGRLRQFNQMGIEIFGSKNIFLEIELILISKRLWKILGIDNHVTLEINTIGTLEDRNKYIDFVNNFLIKHKDKYNNLFLRYKKINIFRLLDSKNKNIRLILKDFPKLINFINKKSVLNFNNLCKELDKLNIYYKINNNLVRGLDYYNDFVFEWTINKSLSSQNTICAGGRYDNLSYLLYDISIPAVGFAIGIDRLVILFKKYNKTLNFNHYIDIYIVSSYNYLSKILGILILEKILNSNLRDFKIYNDYIWCKKLSKKLSKIMILKPRILIIIDKYEINNNYITIKDLHNNKQKIINYKDVVLVLKSLLF